MVYEYPENGTKELLPTEHIEETVEAWAGVPIVYQHPENRQQTATAPETYTGEVIGRAHEPELVDGEKLRVNALLDVEKAEALGGLAAAVVERL